MTNKTVFPLKTLLVYLEMANIISPKYTYFENYVFKYLIPPENIIEKFKGGPVGLNTIATACSEESDTIEEVYEPFLIQEGYIKRTSRGREATELAYKHLKIVPPGKTGTLF